MFNRTTNSRRAKSRRTGAMLVLVAVTLIILLVTMAFTIDVAYMQLTRTELRTAIDAAARAGAESLSREQSTSKALAAALWPAQHAIAISIQIGKNA